MFLRSSSRPQPVECFFCLTTSLLPPNATARTPDRKGKGRASEVGTKWNWHCDRCGCWNVRDQTGQMVSELPAMRTPTMNQDSFALRAKPSTSHLPSSSTATPFCHVCLTNQTLIMNMLANYLPDEDDPTYKTLYDELPSYLASVHARYPPVCANCQPAVDDALRKANHRANVDAWGSALRRADGKRAEGTERQRVYEVLGIAFWRLRGLLFCGSAVLNIGLGATALIAPDRLATAAETEKFGARMATWTLAANLTSILWIAWDPYWLRRRRSRSRARISGRTSWLVDMAVIYLLRLGISGWLVWHHDDIKQSSQRTLLATAAVAEVLIFVHALTSLRISAPVATRPLQPVNLSSAPASPIPALPHNTSSARSDHRTISKHASNPMFGQPAFAPSPPEHQGGRGGQKDEVMEWEPSPATQRHAGTRPAGLEDDDEDHGTWGTPTKNQDWDTFATNRQRMFASRGERDETGLESLIAGWGLGGTADQSVASTTTHSHSRGVHPRQPPLSPMMVASRIVRTVSALLAIARILALSLVLLGRIDDPGMIDTIMSSVEIGVIVMSSTLPAQSRQMTGPRIAFLGLELVMRYIYLFGRQRQMGSFADVLSESWSLGLTWAQWAMLNATRAML